MRAAKTPADHTINKRQIKGGLRGSGRGLDAAVKCLNGIRGSKGIRTTGSKKTADDRRVRGKRQHKPQGGDEPDIILPASAELVLVKRLKSPQKQKQYTSRDGQ